MKLTPTKLKPTGCEEAWMYEYPTRIEVYCHSAGTILSCSITRRIIKDFLNRSVKKTATRKETP